MNFSAALSQLCFLASSLARCRLHPSSSSLRYTSFFSASLVGYVLRTRFGFQGLPIAVERCYGPVGLICLNLALLFRLWNEIWSNVAVVASFYSSEIRTTEWWLAAVLSAAVPAIYVTMGGMRASLFSDFVQASLGMFLLFYLLGVVSYEMRGYDVWSWQPEGGYIPGGWTALLAALLQGFGSYPFHDPVLTDRTFLSTPRTMLLSFFVGGSISMMFIILFSAIGILGDFLANPPLGAVSSGSPAFVARTLCGVTYGLMNMIMMTSSLSTLDSTYTSCSKLVSLELLGWARLSGDTRKKLGPMSASDETVTPTHILIGRCSIIVLGIVGTVYLLAEDEVLKATTVSGTMVMGLGPPIYLMLLWRYNSSPGKGDGFRQAPLAFLLSFVPGVVFGFLYQASGYKNADGTTRRQGSNAPGLECASARKRVSSNARRPPARLNGLLTCPFCSRMNCCCASCMRRLARQPGAQGQPQRACHRRGAVRDVLWAQPRRALRVPRRVPHRLRHPPVHLEDGGDRRGSDDRGCVERRTHRQARLRGAGQECGDDDGRAQCRLSRRTRLMMAG